MYGRVHTDTSQKTKNRISALTNRAMILATELSLPEQALEHVQMFLRSFNGSEPLREDWLCEAMVFESVALRLVGQERQANTVGRCWCWCCCWWWWWW